MTVTPVSGAAITVNLPPGKTAFWTIVAQASYPQYVQLLDSGGVQVFEVTGSSTGGRTPTQIGQGVFTVGPNPYTLRMGYDGGRSWSTVLWGEQSLERDGVTLSGSLDFISEDGADQDFNDSHVSITWFNSIG